MNRYTVFASLFSLGAYPFFPLVKIASVGKLKPLEMELQKLEDLSASIVADFNYMKKREQEMRDTNGTLAFIFAIYFVF